MRIWTYKNADEKAHTFSRRSKNVKKRTKTYEKRILCKFTLTGSRRVFTVVALNILDLFRYNLTHLQSHCHKNSTKIYRTFAEDKRCKPLRFLPAETTLRSTLASFPGSGNTWVRHMIEQATGIYTGSVYADEKSTAGTK